MAKRKVKSKKKSTKKSKKRGSRTSNFAESVAGDARLLSNAYDAAHREAGM